MIAIEVSGGLGNQFFRYAFARNLYISRRNTNEKLVLNTQYVDHHGFSGDINDFKIMSHTSTSNSNVIMNHGTLKQKLLFITYSVLRKISGEKIEKNKSIRRSLFNSGIIIANDPNELVGICWTKNVVASSSFENVSNFDKIKDILQQEFEPKYAPLKSNQHIYEMIKTRNAVCLAVRRGDFMADANKKTFYVCDINYYRNAVAYIKSHVEKPLFVVFSNDIEWVKANLDLEDEMIFESGKDPVWETFRLMKSCKHFIISNSTLHWWAQYLCSNPSKIVIVPNRWYNPLAWNEHLMLDYFVRINTGVKNPYE